MEKQSIVGLVILAVGIAYGVGWFVGGRIDYREETVKIISCSGYSEHQLEYLGYKTSDKKKECEELNLAVAASAGDRCISLMRPVTGLDEAKREFFMARCVYHDVANNIALPRTRALMELR